MTTVAFDDPPLLNAVRAHEPLALRAIVEVAHATVRSVAHSSFWAAGSLLLQSTSLSPPKVCWSR